MGPLGLLSPHPGVSYLFSGENGIPGANPNTYFHPNQHSNPNLHQPHYANNHSGTSSSEEMSSSLYGIANPSGAGSTLGGSVMYGGALGSPPATWTTSLGEMVLKIDGKFKVCLLFNHNRSFTKLITSSFRKLHQRCSRSSMRLRGTESRTNSPPLILY
jgi:hypothetical protein